MSIKKQYLKSRPVCKVTFRLPKENTTDADRVHIVGDFNDWQRDATPMKELKDGTYKATIEVEPDSEYQFRYLIDGAKWENDSEADRYVPTPYGDADNSVLSV